MIFKSFFAMLAVNGDLFVPDFLERLARAQSEEGLRLPPRFFALWRSHAQNRPRQRSTVR